MADCLIRTNYPAGTSARLAPRPQNLDGEVHIVQWDTLEAEATGIARFVTHLVNDRSFLPGEILVLCPRRLLGYSIRDQLVAADIPTHSFYHEEALEEDQAQEAFTLLTLLANPDDRVALRFWLGLGSSTWLAAQYELVRKHCEQSALGLRQVMEGLLNKTIDIPKTSHIQKRFSELQTALQKLQPLAGPELVDALFPSDQSWANALREAALFICKTAPTPREILDYLRTRITQPEMPEEGKFVRVMSLHKSKGLTSRAVIVCGCIEGLIPTCDNEGTPAEQEAKLREGRRLFYVAITRCTDLLMISSFVSIPRKIAYKIGAIVPKGWFKTTNAIASRFLGELGPAAPKSVRGDTVLPKPKEAKK